MQFWSWRRIHPLDLFWKRCWGFWDMRGGSVHLGSPGVESECKMSLKCSSMTTQLIWFFNFRRLVAMNLAYPHQNTEAEGACGLNKKMENEMKMKQTSVSLYYFDKFIIGDIFKTENVNISVLPPPQTNCPLCQWVKLHCSCIHSINLVTYWICEFIYIDNYNY